MQPLAAALLLLYTRLDVPALLAHGTRRGMLDQLLASPGLSVGELARRLGIDYKTALHHARMLAEAGQLVLARDGRRTGCWLPGAPRLRAPPPRAVAALRALAEGADTPAALARALGVPRGTAGSLLAAMARRGLVVASEGRWRVASALRDALPREGDERFSRERAIGRAWSPPSSSAR